MSRTEDQRVYVAERAYELARTGAFDGLEAIKRELVAVGLGDEVRRLAGRSLRDTLDLICILKSVSLENCVRLASAARARAAAPGARR
jgi:hypothetical protein